MKNNEFTVAEMLPSANTTVALCEKGDNYI